MKTHPLSKPVQSAFAAAILGLLCGAAGAQAQSWNLTGNAGTNPANNFLGTIAQPGQPLPPLIIQPGTGGVGIGTNKPSWNIDVKSNHGIKLGLEGNGGGQLVLNNDANDNRIFLEAFNAKGDGSASELLLTGYYARLVPQISLYADRTQILSSHSGDPSLSNAALVIENQFGNQSMQYFSFGGVGKSSIRADSTGNLVFNASTSKYYLGRDFGDPDSITIIPHNSGRTLTIDGNLKVGVLQITGGSDLAEPFSLDEQTPIEPGMVVAIDPVHSGQLRLADHAYDRTVAGIVSGANGVDPGLTMTSDRTTAKHSRPVALTGRVYAWADATHDPIQPGDLLTTADTPGHAMKVTDYTRAQGAILGKAMSALPGGTGLVLVLVSLQ